MNTSFIHAIIGAEVLSLIIGLVLLLGSILEARVKSKRFHWYIILVLSNMIGCTCDLFSWLLDGNSEWIDASYFTTLCSMIMTIFLVGAFVSYLSAYVSERKPISNAPMVIGWTIVAVSILATLIMSMTGNLFTFQDGVFTEQPLYSVYVIVNAASMVSGILIVTRYRNVLDLYDKVGSYAYMLIPMISAGMGLFVENWDFSYPAITVSLLILYIMLQSDRTKMLENEGNLASYQASHDELTGLYNRLAYQNRIQLMKGKEENCGVIFGDLNGLKYVNDTLGHKAGDQLLIHFAKVLTDHFRLNDIYRISGDEFVCILEDVSEETLEKRFSEFESILRQEQPPLACVGSAYGCDKDIEILISDAENKMYKEKKIVHERFPRIRR